MVQTVKQKQTAKRASVAKKTHERKSKERAQETVSLKGLYISQKDDPVLQDILSKAKSFAAYHTKMAQDGVGVRKTGYKLENGSEETETIYYTTEKRVSELDKSAGILEIVDYIERQFNPPSEVATKRAK